MNRRTFTSVLGTGGICAVGLGVAYQLDQGNISLGGSSEISGSVSDSPGTFEFDVDAGVEISISVTDTGAAPYSGSFSLRDPAGNEVIEAGPHSSSLVRRTHTAEQGGTYRLVVNPQRTRLTVAVDLDHQTDS